jgi:D-glycero-alpha-D-manno-heptose-7-phosphate kinase
MYTIRVPLRISFAGGGGDFPEIFYSVPSNIVSSTLNKYVYIEVEERTDSKILIYEESKTAETFETTVEEIKPKHGNLILSCLFQHKNMIQKGLNIKVTSETGKGSGLGASSAIVLGMQIVLNKYLNLNASVEDLIKKCIYAERYLANIPGGIQDFFPALFGPNIYLHLNREKASVTKIEFNDMYRKFCENVILIKVPENIDRLEVIRKQITQFNSDFETVNPTYIKLSKYGMRTYNAIKKLDNTEMRENILKSANLKKKLVEESTLEALTSKWIESNKIWGHKILGAGSGGHLALYFDTNKKDEIEKILMEEQLIFFSPRVGIDKILFLINGKEIDMNFDNQIINLNYN